MEEGGGEHAKGEDYRREISVANLEFAKDAVNHPVDSCGRHAVARTNGLALKVLYDKLDERPLHTRRILNHNLLSSLLRLEHNRLVGKYAEGQVSFVANDFDTVLAGRIVRHEAPRARAW